MDESCNSPMTVDDIRYSFRCSDHSPRLGSRFVVLAVAVAFVLAAGVGIRHVIVEGELVEKALREGQRLRLLSEVARIREAIDSAEAEALKPLARTWSDATSLRAAAQKLEGASPVPTSHCFVIGAAGEVIYPGERSILGPLRDPERSDEAAAILGAAEELARDGRLENAIGAYSRFLDEFPAPAPEAQMRPQAWLRCAALFSREGRPSEAARSLLRLEQELASEETPADAELVDFCRKGASPILEDLGHEADAVHSALLQARESTDGRLARERFRTDLRNWLAARIRLEVASGVDQGVAPETHLTILAAGTRRRFVFATTFLRSEPVVVGYESDLSRIRDEVIVPRIDGRTADDLAFRLVPAPRAPDPLVVPLGPDLPGLYLGPTFSGTDPAARAARTRQLLYGGLVAGTLLIGVLAAALVFRHARQTMALARLRSEFVSGVSHELRTPVALIQAIVDTLELDHVRDEEERAGYLRTMSCECQRLAALVGNILDFSRTERGRTRYDVREADIGTLLGSLVETYRPALEARNLAAEVVLAPDLPLARVDPEAFTRAVLNLLDNAMKYAAESRILEITGSRDGERIRVSVADHGPGIAPDDLPHIFEPFRRGRAVHERAVRGVGLGLSLVRQILRGMGGEVTVESRVGEGTTFHLFLEPATE